MDIQFEELNVNLELNPFLRIELLTQYLLSFPSQSFSLAHPRRRALDATAPTPGQAETPAEAAAPETAEAAEAQPDVEDKASEGTRQTGLAVAVCARNLALRT